MNTSTPPATHIGLFSALESLNGTIATLEKRAQELEDGLHAVLAPIDSTVGSDPERAAPPIYAPAVDSVLALERRVRALSDYLESITVRVAL